MPNPDIHILVTGGAGYIGSHTCKMLSQKGFIPIAYDNLVNGHQWAVKWGPLEVGDILDSERLNEVFQKYRPIAVMHFAAYAYVGESVQYPYKYYHNNVSGSLNLLHAMVQNGVDKIVFSSTCATYGIPQTIPVSEIEPQVPINPYGRSKFMIENILEDFQKAYGIKSIPLRYFNAFGADVEGDIGEYHRPETHLVPIAIDVSQGRQDVLEVFGNDYQTSDGTAVRDYIHVTDLADAHIKALAYLLDNGNSLAFNLGIGEGYTVLEIVKMIEKIGNPINLRFAKRREGDPPVLIAKAEKAKELLGWVPQYTDLEAALKTAWTWHSKLG